MTQPDILKVHGYHWATDSYLTDVGVLNAEDLERAVHDGEFVVGVGVVDEALRWPDA